MTKSISVLGKPTERIRVNGRGRERRGPSCLCEPTILPRRKPREGRTRDSEAEDEAVHGLSGHRCGPRADWRRQRRGSKDGRAMVRRGAEAWPRSQSQTQGRGDPRRASVCGAEIQGSRGFRLRETPHTKKLGRGDAHPALSSSPAYPCRTSSPASARQVSGLPCTAPRAPPVTPASAGKSHRKRISRTQAATPRHAGRPGHSPSRLARAASESSRERRSSRGLAMSPRRLHCAVGRPARRGGRGPSPGLAPLPASPSLAATENVSRCFECSSRGKIIPK